MPGVGAASQQSPGGVGTGFVNLQTYLGLNRGAGEQMAGAVGGELSRSRLWGDRANPGTMPGEHAARINAAKGEGVGTLLQDVYGRGAGGYSSGQRGLDAVLTRAAGGNQLDAAAKQHGAWLGYLGLPSGQPTGKAGAPQPTTGGLPAAGLPAPHKPTGQAEPLQNPRADWTQADWEFGRETTPEQDAAWEAYRRQMGGK